MNTLSDTAEGRATPSAWPVYVAAAVLLALGVLIVFPVPARIILSPRGLEILHWYDIALGVWGILGLVAAVGLVGLRSWGWWCGALLAAAWMVLVGWGVLHGIVQFFRPPEYWPNIDALIFLAAAWVVVIALLVWPLATRRPLFFPTKPEGEE